MNLLLLLPDEVGHDGIATLSDRRAEHAAKVLRVKPGATLLAGILDGAQGQAEVIESDRRTLVIRFSAETQPETRPDATLLLAIPRPKVLSRCLEHAATLGFGHICLVRSQRVEKSHLQSRSMTPESMHRHLLLGLEQGRRTALPTLRVFPQFRAFTEDFLPSSAVPKERILAHQDSERMACSYSPGSSGPYCLAIGPEGGWLPFEVEALQAEGFASLQFGLTALRVESALSYITGQLDLLIRS